jgi:hypothetical protein
MTKYLIVATLQVGYEIPIEAEDEQSALATLDKWIDEDFKPYTAQATWDFDVLENDDN